MWVTAAGGLAVVLGAVAASAVYAPSIKPQGPRRVVTQFDLAAASHGTLYAVDAEGYDDPIYVANITAASHHDVRVRAAVWPPSARSQVQLTFGPTSHRLRLASYTPCWPPT
jgi:hypothetical protein